MNGAPGGGVVEMRIKYGRGDPGVFSVCNIRDYELGLNGCQSLG